MSEMQWFALSNGLFGLHVKWFAPKRTWFSKNQQKLPKENSSCGKTVLSQLESRNAPSEKQRKKRPKCLANCLANKKRFQSKKLWNLDLMRWALLGYVSLRSPWAILGGAPSKQKKPVLRTDYFLLKYL